jgi:hypothetical protein
MDEATRPLPGDELVAGAKIRWTHAVTIQARRADVWPWLVQMGCRRAGWYSYDGLDNGGAPSAKRITPELQQVRVGDVFPMTPKAEELMLKVFWHPNYFGMQRRQLLTIKRLVETA